MSEPGSNVKLAGAFLAEAAAQRQPISQPARSAVAQPTAAGGAEAGGKVSHLNALLALLPQDAEAAEAVGNTSQQQPAASAASAGTAQRPAAALMGPLPPVEVLARAKYLHALEQSRDSPIPFSDSAQTGLGAEIARLPVPVTAGAKDRKADSAPIINSALPTGIESAIKPWRKPDDLEASAAKGTQVGRAESGGRASSDIVSASGPVISGAGGDSNQLAGTAGRALNNSQLDSKAPAVSQVSASNTTQNMNSLMSATDEVHVIEKDSSFGMGYIRAYIAKFTPLDVLSFGCAGVVMFLFVVLADIM